VDQRLRELDRRRRQSGLAIDDLLTSDPAATRALAIEWALA
jgi:hypothetical protein